MMKSLCSVLACLCLVAVVGCESTQEADTEVAPGAVTECTDCTDKADCADKTDCAKGEECCQAEASMGAMGEGECCAKEAAAAAPGAISEDCEGKTDCEKVCPVTGEASMGAISESSDCAEKSACCAGDKS